MQLVTTAVVVAALVKKQPATPVVKIQDKWIYTTSWMGESFLKEKEMSNNLNSYVRLRLAEFNKVNVQWLL